MSGILIDSNVLIDVATRDPVWYGWSRRVLSNSSQSPLVINPIILAEISVRFPSAEALEIGLGFALLLREHLPFEAAFAAGKAFLAYKQRGGVRTSPLPDFYIGAHAQYSGYRLLTRDAARYRTYFPDVELITPETHP